jgi:serine/threonine protein phosphatase PrpC
MEVGIGQVYRAKPGEHACGDRVLVVGAESSTALLMAVIDGLGHGPQAAAAAAEAGDFLTEHAALALEDLFRKCDRAIAHTRGVAMTVVRLDRQQQQLSHAAVGNVELHSISHENIRPVPKPGIVGGRITRVRESRFRVVQGDVFALFSDGISSRVDLTRYREMPAQDAAESILRDYGKEHDDASCAVLKC